MSDYFSPTEQAGLAEQITLWLEQIATHTPEIAAVDRGTSDDSVFGDPRWYIRMRGHDKEFTTIWLTLGQRTLRYETYVMPAPEENAVALYENLLRRNERLVGAHFSIGIEDAIFLRGEMLVAQVTESNLDRLLGTLYSTVEQCFRALLRIGFASRFSD
jgi:hypothetical protein